MDDIEIIIPERSQDKISNDLRIITKQFELMGYNIGGYGLGGEYGYGFDYENNIFMIHHYCWCDNNNCKWCNDNTPNFHHKSSNLKIWWYKWIGRSMEIECNSNFNWHKIMKECLQSIQEKT